MARVARQRWRWQWLSGTSPYRRPPCCLRCRSPALQRWRRPPAARAVPAAAATHIQAAAVALRIQAAEATVGITLAEPGSTAMGAALISPATGRAAAFIVRMETVCSSSASVRPTLITMAITVTWSAATGGCVITAVGCAGVIAGANTGDAPGDPCGFSRRGKKTLQNSVMVRRNSAVGNHRVSPSGVAGTMSAAALLIRRRASL